MFYKYLASLSCGLSGERRKLLMQTCIRGRKYHVDHAPSQRCWLRPRGIRSRSTVLRGPEMRGGPTTLLTASLSTCLSQFAARRTAGTRRCARLAASRLLAQRRIAAGQRWPPRLPTPPRSLEMMLDPCAHRRWSTPCRAAGPGSDRCWRRGGLEALAAESQNHGVHLRRLITGLADSRVGVPRGAPQTPPRPRWWLRSTAGQAEQAGSRGGSGECL